MDASQQVEANTAPRVVQSAYTLWQLVRYFLRLGTLGFGGPLAAQLAVYLGYIRYRILGATLVGLAFIWPSL